MFLQCYQKYFTVVLLEKYAAYLFNQDLKPFIELYSRSTQFLEFS